jgi:hypothetical protein
MSVACCQEARDIDASAIDPAPLDRETGQDLLARFLWLRPTPTILSVEIELDADLAYQANHTFKCFVGRSAELTATASRIGRTLHLPPLRPSAYGPGGTVPRMAAGPRSRHSGRQRIAPPAILRRDLGSCAGE